MLILALMAVVYSAPIGQPSITSTAIAVDATGKITQIKTIDANGRVSSTLAETQVLFDGTPAPLLYAQSGQINAGAPN
jgi:uncharacterized protein (TIGR03437 family)